MKSIIITGAPGSGKTTLFKALCAEGYCPRIDFTTRKIRQSQNEIDGVDRYFVSRDLFEYLYFESFFIEESLDFCLYKGNYYGTPKGLLKLDKVCVAVVVSVEIAEKIRKENDCFWVHLVSESSERGVRLRGRTEELLEIEGRLKNDDGDSNNISHQVDLVLDTSKLTVEEEVSSVNKINYV